MGMVRKHDNGLSRLVGLSIFFSAVLPHTFQALLWINPFLCLLLWGLQRKRHILSMSFLIIVPLTVSLSVYLVQYKAVKAIVLCVAIMLYSLCFPLTGRDVEVKPIYFFITISYILLTQLAYVLNISFVTNLLDTLYPFEGSSLADMYSHMRTHIAVDNMFNYRLGGLYRNPNDCARAVSFLFVAFLLLYKDNRRNITIFSLLSFVSILMTGSRTGLAVAMIFFAGYVLINKDFSSSFKLSVLGVGAATLVLLTTTPLFSFRGLDISQGFSNSANYKMETFLYYIQNESSLGRLLFGYLNPDLFVANDSVKSHFDADFGYLVFNYGLVGFMGILLFNMLLFLRMKPLGRTFFLVLLWMVSSTVYSSYRGIFMYILLLSLVFNKYYNGSHMAKFRV